MDSSTRNGFRRAAAITARVMAMPSASWVGVFTANIVNMAAREAHHLHARVKSVYH